MAARPRGASARWCAAFAVSLVSLLTLQPADAAPVEGCATTTTGQQLCATLEVAYVSPTSGTVSGGVTIAPGSATIASAVVSIDGGAAVPVNAGQFSVPINRLIECASVVATASDGTVATAEYCEPPAVTQDPPPIVPDHPDILEPPDLPNTGGANPLVLVAGIALLGAGVVTLRRRT